MFHNNFSISPNIMPGVTLPHYAQNHFKEAQGCDIAARRRVRPVSNAARERSRVKTLRSAFLDLQESLPSVPPDTKLSKLDVLILATTYINHLMKTLDNSASNGNGKAASVPVFHPVKKWPMRTRLYDGIIDSTKPAISTKRRKVEALKPSRR